MKEVTKCLRVVISSVKRKEEGRLATDHIEETARGENTESDRVGFRDKESE